jgi:hypothetical protein
MKSREVVEQIYGKPKTKEQKSLEDFKRKAILRPEKPKSMEIPDNAIGIDEFKDWLIQEDLTFDIEQQIQQQETYYQQFYGEDYQIDRNKLFIEKDRLPSIKHGIETQTVNYALITATPEELTEQEQQQTEAEYVYHKLIEPLKQQGLKIWAEAGIERWTKLTLEEWLKRVQTVAIEDFDLTKLTNDDWEQELTKVIDRKGEPQRQQPNKLDIIFTDNRQDVPEQPEHSFNDMIKSKTKALNPEQWMILASQLYQKDKTEISKNTWDWLMAIVDHRDKTATPKVSAVLALSVSVGLRLDSSYAPPDGSPWRWRVAL